jgi:uncharacterized protein
MNRRLPKPVALLSPLAPAIILAIVALSLPAQQQTQPQPRPQQRLPLPPLPPGYTRAEPLVTGAAPKMKGQLLSAESARIYRLTFGQGDEILSGISEFANTNHIDSAFFTGIGGLLAATLGWGDPTNGAFKVINVDQKCELVSLIGNITLRNGKPFVHAHMVVSLSDGSARGGHLLDAHVSPFAEIYIVEANPPAPPKSAAEVR